MLKTGEGDINTPVNIPCSGPIGKSFIQVSSGQTNGVSPPMLCPSEKTSNVLFQSAKGDEKVGGSFEIWLSATDSALSVLQLCWIQEASAMIALVALGVFPAFRAFSNYKPVGEELITSSAKDLLNLLLIEKAFLLKDCEVFLNECLMG